VCGWVCYRLVSELLVETLRRYGLGMLVRILWSILNFDCEVEKLRRNGVADATQETERHRTFVRVRRIMTVPFNSGTIYTVGSGRSRIIGSEDK